MLYCTAQRKYLRKCAYYAQLFLLYIYFISALTSEVRDLASVVL